MRKIELKEFFGIWRCSLTPLLIDLSIRDREYALLDVIKDNKSILRAEGGIRLDESEDTTKLIIVNIFIAKEIKLRIYSPPTDDEFSIFEKSVYRFKRIDIPNKQP